MSPRVSIRSGRGAVAVWSAKPAGAGRVQGRTVTAVGDSLTAGSGGSGTDGGWRGQVFGVDRPDLITIGGLSDPIEIAPHNLHEGHGGFPSASFKASEPAWYIANPADISMIMYGTNDANNGTPTAAVCIQNIVDGVGLILAQNAAATSS